jgi:hypothetical protein
MRRGEPVTDVRVTSVERSSDSRLPPGWVATTLRVSDPAAGLVVAPGDRVRVIAGAETDPASGSGASSSGAPGSARVVVDDAVVLATGRRDPGHDLSSTGSGQGLLGAMGTGGGGRDDDGDGALPAGVLVLGVPDSDALALAAVSGVRFLTVVRQSPLPAG